MHWNHVGRRVLDAIFRSPRTRFVGVLFFGALLLRVAIVFAVGDTDHPEMYEHGEIARNLSEGRGFTMHWPYTSLDSNRRAELARPPTHEGAFLPPMNPYIIYGVYELLGNSPAARLTLMLFYSLVGSLSVVLTYYAATELAGESAARATALIAAVFLPGAYSVTTFSGSVLYHLLGVAIFLVAMRLMRNRTLTSALVLGLLCGCMTLVRSEFFVLGFCLIAVSAFFAAKGSARRRSRVQLFAVATIVCAGVIAPWTYRNTVLFGRFVPVLSHPWYEMWRGENPYASGSTTDGHGRTIWVEPERYPELIRAMDSIPYDRYFEPNVDRIFMHEVLGFITAHPGSFIALAGTKLLYLVTVDMNSASAKSPINMLSMFPVMVLILAGFFVLVRRRTDLGITMLFGTFIAYYVALTVMTVMLSRYQIYLYVSLLPLAAVSLDSILQHRWLRARSGGLTNVKQTTFLRSEGAR